MNVEQGKKEIQDGTVVLGIEMGSTRIKAVLIGSDNRPLETGSHQWENQYVDNVWTYSEADIWEGIQKSFTDLNRKVEDRFGLLITKLGAMGLSGMMHGYLAFDEHGELLMPFRTWRNNITGEASEKLTEAFRFNIPQRWSIAHLYQAILNEEDHVKDISYITTLAGYIHWKLTGSKVLGIGEASGVFPIDSTKKTYHQDMIESFDQIVAPHSFNWTLNDILPQVLGGGEKAGELTSKGAKLLDASGHLQPGIPMCPPEGDAGTGMVATNSIAQRTGNVSAGTSAFAMVVLEKELSKVHPEIDLVCTPAGAPVAMAHSNNCSSDINAWIKLFKEFSDISGMNQSDDDIFTSLFNHALQGDKDAGGLLTYGYLSGEHMTHFEEGRPLFVRGEGSQFNLANFMRSHLYTAFGAMKIGMDILVEEEEVRLDEVLAHGGIFKTEGVASKILAGALNTPVSVMKTADEGGAWGIALLANYMVYKKERGADFTLDAFLNHEVFINEDISRTLPDEEDRAGFEQYMERYKKGLTIERAAVNGI